MLAVAFVHTFEKSVLLNGEIATIVIPWRSVLNERTGPTAGSRAFTRRANAVSRRQKINTGDRSSR